MSNIKFKEGIWTKCRFPVFYVIILLFLVLLYVLDMTQLNFKPIRFVSQDKIDTTKGFIVKTSGCRIPILDPFDKIIIKYVHKPKKFSCSLIPPLVSSNATSLYIELDALKHYTPNTESVECCYQPFWRQDPIEYSEDNAYGFDRCHFFNISTNIVDEFVKVYCKVNNTLIYKDFHSFVTEKRTSEVVPRDIISHEMGTDKLNVLIIGLDSISRLNFQRQMPLTLQFLKQKLKTIEVLGYNKVGDNTFPNIMPILTGFSVDELKELCWQNIYMKFDDCPFIWQNFSRAGYATSYAEDSSWMGLFNYVKKGFKQQPTDYYWRTFNLIAEREIGHNRPYNADLCIGSRPSYIVLLDYIMKFVTSLGNKPFFSFFWGSSLSHDNLNYPSLGDEIYKQFFETLKGTNVLNQSVLIVLSDHGMRWGEIRSTHQGQLEERLPFLFFGFPDWFQKKYSTAIANMRRNAHRLTTPYDMHETIKDILHLSNILPNNIRLRSKNVTGRGISLFLQVPENRTCLSAGIAPHWCTCQKSVDIKLNDTYVQKAAEFIVNHINFLLQGYKACSKLKLSNILDAKLQKTDDYVASNSAIHDYTLIIKTNPGGALFEATVRCVLNQIFNETIFNMTGTISRINLYGNQSSCITDFHLKLYCYCSN